MEEKLSESSLQRRKRQAERRSQEFIKGPIPLAWLRRAGKLSKAAVLLGLGLWFLRGIQGSKDNIRVTHGLLDRLGISRQAGYRGLQALESDGLVTVERRPGHCPLVTILD